ncbi:MAG: class I SAM-dependent methyltransferase [Halioglobus sp.]
MSLFCTPFGAFRLKRYPSQPRETLQAYCSADALLLESLAETKRVSPADDVLVVNDEHGALSIPLSAGHYKPTLWTDSALSHLAIINNANSCNQKDPSLVWSIDSPPSANVVLMRVPKLLPYFEHQLATLSSRLAPGAVVEIAGMDKHLSPRTGDIIERYLGPTTRHRGARKARRFTAIVAKDQPSTPAALLSRQYDVKAPPLTLQSLPNVFSADRLDGGSQLLLSTLAQIKPAEEVIDLACGNGVLGLAAIANGITGSLTFCDESAMAIESARRNVQHLPASGSLNIKYYHGDGLLGLTVRPDLILCNPPFHLHHVVDEFAGQRLLRQCAKVLKPDGSLLLVANRHLKYAPLLRRHFTQVERLVEDNRFVVWRAIAG